MPDEINLITGARGQLGSHIAEQLRAAGVPVRALVRPGKDAAFLRGLGVDLVEGDLRDPATARRLPLCGPRERLGPVVGLRGGSGHRHTQPRRCVQGGRRPPAAARQLDLGLRPSEAGPRRIDHRGRAAGAALLDVGLLPARQAAGRANRLGISPRNRGQAELALRSARPRDDSAHRAGGPGAACADPRQRR